MVTKKAENTWLSKQASLNGRKQLIVWVNYGANERVTVCNPGLIVIGNHILVLSLSSDPC